MDVIFRKQANETIITVMNDRVSLRFCAPIIIHVIHSI